MIVAYIDEHKHRGESNTVQRLKAVGTRWFATDTIRVTTSARREGRIADGFAGFMRNLDELASGEETAQL